MKSFKKIGLALLITASMGAFSTAALAESDPGRITYAPAEAIDLVLSNIKIAQTAIAEHNSGEMIAGKILDALHASKEINANDRVDAARAKGNDRLKAAKKAAKEGKIDEASKELDDAAKKFADLKPLI